MVSRQRPPQRQVAGVPGPRRRALGARRLAQLATTRVARRAGATAPGPQARDASASGLRTPRDTAAGPPLELRDAPRVRGPPAHADRQGSRDERADDRAAL